MPRRIPLNRPGAGKAAMDAVRAVADALGPEGGDPVVRQATFIAEREMKLELSRPGSGTEYRRRGVVHRASAPGEPPAPDTGALRNSVTHEIVGNVGYIGTGLAYGRHLEYGTPTIEPRPWARTVAERLPDMVGSEIGPVAREAVTIAVRRNG